MCVCVYLCVRVCIVVVGGRDLKTVKPYTVEPRLSGPRSYGHLDQPGSTI